MELIDELQIYLDPPKMRNSDEQNTAALIASSMTGDYEDDWSLTENCYQSPHDSLPCNSTSNKFEVAESSLFLPEETNLSAIEVSSEELPLLTFNEYDEIRNYTDLDVLGVTEPLKHNETISITENTLECVESAPQEPTIGETTAIVNTNEEKTNIESPPKWQNHEPGLLPKKKKVNINKPCKVTQAGGRPPKDIAGQLNLLTSHVSAVENVIKPRNKPGSSLTPFKVPTAISAAPKDIHGPSVACKLTTKVPSYLTAFPMKQCKDYPIVYSCNNCESIFTTIRAGQLHDCVKKRRGRKAGTKLQSNSTFN